MSNLDDASIILPFTVIDFLGYINHNYEDTSYDDVSISH
jgi:hypothetical protein